MKVRITIDVDAPATLSWAEARILHRDAVDSVAENGLTVRTSKVAVLNPPKSWQGLTEMQFGKRR